MALIKATEVGEVIKPIWASGGVNQPFIIGICCLLRLFQRINACFAGPDPQGISQIKDKDLAIPDRIGVGGGPDRFHDALNLTILNGDFQLDFWHESNGVLIAAVNFGLAPLAAIAADLGNRQPADPQLNQGFVHIINAGRFYNRDNVFPGCPPLIVVVATFAMLGEIEAFNLNPV